MVTGMIDPASFLERLQNMLAAYSGHLRRLHQEAQRQAENTQLLQEQDREFLAAVEADRQRVRVTYKETMLIDPPSFSPYCFLC